MRGIKVFLFLMVFIFLVLPLSGLELKQGKVKLVLHEETGRFSSYYLTDVRRNRYTPFILDDDPRTTVMSLLVGNKVYRMGESSDFSQSIQKTGNGADFIWKSSTLEVRESFSFISSIDSGLDDGYSVTITITNTSETPQNIGMRYLFDTYLGENDNTHFSTPSRTAILEESDFTGTLPNYWISSGKNAADIALQCMMKGPGITTPDRLVMANWKRLNDSSWNFESRSSRNFNLLPYSINDSSVCMFYNPREIPSGEKRVITVVFGNYSESGFALSEREDEAISELYTQTLETTDNADPLETVRTDLLSVRDLISRIDSLIMSGEDVTQEQVDAVTQIILTLENRKKQLE